MKYQIPGKTFLTGEYSVLVGGAALGLATKPYFEVSVLESTENNQPFHSESSAGKFLNITKNKYQIIFEDSYQKLNIKGGFGRSGAEFLSVMLAEGKTFQEIMDCYRQINQNIKNKPSGADLAFQYYGGICLAQIYKNEYKSFEWPFADLNFFVVATGIKVNTHTHLNDLDLENAKHLPKFSNQVIESFLNKNEKEFINNLSNWSRELNQCGLQLEESWVLKKNLEVYNEILLVKPCGALGADVILVFYQKSQKFKVENIIQNYDLKIVSESQDLSKGLVSYVG